MKKVLLTKSQQIRVTTTPDIKMISHQIGATTTKTTQRLPVINSTGIRLMHVQTNVITNTYMQRKSYQSIYEDIFKLLMRLPDKALQQRVIDAINGSGDNKSQSSVISDSNQCKQCSKKVEKPLQVNASTQTESLEIKDTPLVAFPSSKDVDNKVNVNNESSPTPLKQESPATPPSRQAANVSSDKPTDPSIKVPRKRGRKRNTCVPQVVKRSAAQMALQEREEKQLTPLPSVKKKKLEIVPSSSKSSPQPIASSPSQSILQRRDSSVSNISSYIGDINDYCQQIDDYINNDTQRTIYTTMSNEYLKAHVMSEEGLLPIHDAILKSNVNAVQRQLFVWTKMKENVDVNDLLSADGEDCLQLAITNDSDPSVVEIVLKAGVLPLHIYEDSNTAIHLAIINNIKLESLRQLMLHVDLNLLLQTNDDGYTALHIAVRHNRYKMAEIICDVIDERQLGAPVYMREETSEEKRPQTNSSSSSSGSSGSSTKSPELKEEQKFAKFYERACDRLEQNKAKLMGRRLKSEVLNASEARAGNSSLFYAVEGEWEHFCYFLLAHLSDPDEENLSGHSAKSYHYEFARVLRINLKVARVMDKVHGILNGK